MEVFATFDIMNSKGVKVAEGHKASFCLEDNQCMPGVKPFYACANFGDQGISVNCTDIYRHNIDCQWVDISELNPGMYTFKVRRLSDGKSRYEIYDIFLLHFHSLLLHVLIFLLSILISPFILPYLSVIFLPIVTCFFFLFHLSRPSSPRIASLRFLFFIFFSFL